MNTPSDIFQSQVVIHRVSQFLFASQVVLCRLNRCMAKQELNLFKFSPQLNGRVVNLTHEGYGFARALSVTLTPL
jgi:hypothetical protein